MKPGGSASGTVIFRKAAICSAAMYRRKDFRTTSLDGRCCRRLRASSCRLSSVGMRTLQCDFHEFQRNAFCWEEKVSFEARQRHAWTRRAYPHLAFKGPAAIVPAPGTDRLFATEQGGRAYSFRDDPESREADLFLGVAELVARFIERTAKQPDDKLSVSGLFGIAFHPAFAENRPVFVSYAVGYEAGGAKPRFENGARVVRLTASYG